MTKVAVGCALGTGVAALTCSVAGSDPPWREDLERFVAVGGG
ncbi:hypothetical protein ACFYZ2_34075 [Streptomyces sviceus]